MNLKHELYAPIKAYCGRCWKLLLLWNFCAELTKISNNGWILEVLKQ